MWRSRTCSITSTPGNRIILFCRKEWIAVHKKDKGSICSEKLKLQTTAGQEISHTPSATDAKIYCFISKEKLRQLHQLGLQGKHRSRFQTECCVYYTNFWESYLRIWPKSDYHEKTLRFLCLKPYIQQHPAAAMPRSVLVSHETTDCSSIFFFN